MQLNSPPFVGPNSFADALSEHDEKCPAPKHFSDEVILKPLPTTKAEYLYGFELKSEGNLVCTD